LHLFKLCNTGTYKIAAVVTVICYFILNQRKEGETREKSIICSFIFLLLFAIYKNNVTLKTGLSVPPGIEKMKNCKKLTLAT
jgi:hypothetical protein